jgi:hypothetical protein
MKGSSLAYSGQCPSIYLEGLKETTKHVGIARVTAEIRTQHLRNTT